MYGGTRPLEKSSGARLRPVYDGAMSVAWSRHPHLEEAVEQARVAFERARLLTISGPSGAGKSWLARRLHELGPDGAAPYLAQDAAGLPDHRFESQLFGHVKGAFTGAARPFAGFLGVVGEGALCIEGLEDLSGEAQAKMLRFLQARVYRQVGSGVESQFAGRLIFTCREPLRALLDRGLLREDFYFRVSGFELRLPPLAERPRDAEALCRALYSALRREMGSATPACSDEDLAGLARRGLPGNLHGVRNALQQAMLRGVSPLAIEPPPRPEPEGQLPETGSLRGDLHALERRLLVRGLRQHPHSRKELAARLGVSLRSLMYKLKDHGLS